MSCYVLGSVVFFCWKIFKLTRHLCFLVFYVSQLNFPSLFFFPKLLTHSILAFLHSLVLDTLWSFLLPSKAFMSFFRNEHNDWILSALIVWCFLFENSLSSLLLRQVTESSKSANCAITQNRLTVRWFQSFCIVCNY